MIVGISVWNWAVVNIHNSLGTVLATVHGNRSFTDWNCGQFLTTVSAPVTLTHRRLQP